jgi:hypothetical protein
MAKTARLALPHLRAGLDQVRRKNDIVVIVAALARMRNEHVLRNLGVWEKDATAAEQRERARLSDTSSR